MVLNMLGPPRRLGASDDPRLPLGAGAQAVGFGVVDELLLDRVVDFRSRFSHMQMLAAWTVLIGWCMTSGLATVCWRDLTQSKKLRTWFIGRPVRSMYSASSFSPSASSEGEETSGFL